MPIAVFFDSAKVVFSGRQFSIGLHTVCEDSHFSLESDSCRQLPFEYNVPLILVYSVTKRRMLLTNQFIRVDWSLWFMAITTLNSNFFLADTIVLLCIIFILMIIFVYLSYHCCHPEPSYGHKKDNAELLSLLAVSQRLAVE